MSSSISNVLVGVLFLASPCFAQDADTDSLLANVRGIHTFDCQISPRLPVFSFAVVGDSDNYISEIRISKKGSKVIRQVLDVFTDEPPYKGSNYIQFEDLNFDGYKDIKVLTAWGSGGEGYLVWLFNPLKAEFIPNKQLSGLSNIEAHPKDSTICSHSQSGWASGSAEVYRYDGDSLVLIRSESIDWIESEQHFLKTIRIRQNGVMIDSSRQVIKDRNE